MKKLYRKNGRVTKGFPSAVLLSILIHVALFLLAGTLVIFTVVKKRESRKITPPNTIERPKMDLRKPVVRQPKPDKPKPSARISPEIKKRDMPEIALSDMPGMIINTEGIVGELGSVPEFGEANLFGSGYSIGNDLVGTFYDFKRDRTGKAPSVAMAPAKYMQTLKNFMEEGWKPSVFSRYYRSPKKSYATAIMIPPMLAEEAPSQFGEPDTGGWLWAVHYKGQLVRKEATTFRFWGSGDDILLVRVDGKIVLNACWHNENADTTYSYFSTLWRNHSADSWKYFLGNNTSTAGDWITLEAGIPLDMEVLIGKKSGYHLERKPGGDPASMFCAMLLVEVKGEEYPSNRRGAPIFPIFKTAEPSRNLLEGIHKNLVLNEASLTNGPVFSDYDTGAQVTTNALATKEVESAMPTPTVEEPKDGKMRIWTMEGGQSVEAELVTVIGRKAVLRDSRGRQHKIQLDQLSLADRRFIELDRPPEFKIDLSRKTSQWKNPTNPFEEISSVPPTQLDHVFTAKLKQTSAGAYSHSLKVEFFAIGKEAKGGKYTLLDRQESHFIPAKENARSHEFSGKKVTIYTTAIDGEMRGIKYYGYLVVVTDLRGKIIQHAESNKWLFEHLENLKRVPVGKYMDKTGTRVSPTNPKRTMY